RKIRNKQSAQDSRRRKKEYIEGLESRVTACSAQNQLLQNKVSELEKHNGSLLSQLRRLRGLIAPTSNKAAQTSTCLLILIFSLGLLILPSYSPLRGGPRPDREGYKPIGVISRTILTKGGFLDPAEPPSTKEPDLSRQDPEPPQGHLLGAATVQEGADENPRLPQERGTNTSALPQPSDPQTEPQEGLIQGKRPRGNVDAAKPVHADEM
uniref:Cyclic AMP-responsive element-binding protein 3-like protein 4 n=1 Tax=Sphenodon punctatus TaxID=8508 RepID=A0A8D0GFD7_SPHPU